MNGLQLLKRTVINLLPDTIQSFLMGMRTLAIEYGYLRSIRQKACVDKDGRPIPWYTYSSIEYLKQLDLSAKSVFEFGSGNSTLFWSKEVGKIVSVEHDQGWYNRLSDQVSDNVEYRLCVEKAEYLDSITTFEPFDIIIIDGVFREQCAQRAIDRLKPGGFIILDNADWWVDAARFLREKDLIQIDFYGPGPLVPYTWCTSLFFSRSFQWQTKYVNQPTHGLGSLKQHAGERFAL